ncbi:hypothetical protein [Microbacterium paludicola]|uniref:hypothetical protein n=1 Tax=Microbacterium paludicola TaxID=300019 RepID=UPI0031DDA5BA
MPEFEMQTGGPVVTIGPDSLDAVRIRVREATYPNAETERRMIDAVDRAAFDRVRFVEQGLIENARRTIPRHDERVREAGEITEALNGLAERLARGASPTEVAEEFQKVQARAIRAQQRLGRV